MGKFLFKDAVVMFDGRDISGELSAVALDYSADIPEATAFGDTSKVRLPGVLDVTANQQGWWDSVSAGDSLDKDLFDDVGAASSHMSFSPDGGQLGEIAFSFPTLTGEYTQGASHGEVFAFGLTVSGTGILVRGKVMEKSAFGTGVNNGTTRQVGQVLVAETAYSIIHATAVAGTNPTLDVVIESAVTDFATITTRMTHPQLTAVGSNRQSVVGAITDTWWRLVLTVGGTDTPSFTVFGMIGIQQTTLP